MKPKSPDAKTRLYGVFGNPVAQSLSPLMHNLAFSITGENGVYCAFQVTDIGRAMDAVRTLDMGGASVTIPHKVTVMDHLDHVDELARNMGAVNTVVNKDGKLLGTNTDGPGAARSLLEKTSLKNKKVLLVGSGGAARAIGYAIREEGGAVTVLNRKEDREEGETLANELGVRFVLLSGIRDLDGDVLINATPVGMAPDTDAIPVPEEIIKPGMAVMDAVYHPIRTRLLKVAQDRGCVTVDGASMFVNQGVAQFELWTGKSAPAEAMRSAVLDALGEN